MLTLAPDMEKRLRNVAAGHGLAPEKALETLLNPVLAEAETEMQETLAGLRQSAADFAAGRWATPEELDAVLKTQLHEAVFAGDEVTVKSLLSTGENVNERDHRGWTPLHEAVYNSSQNVVETLLQNAAGVNLADARGRTPLHWAAEDGWVDIVETLLDAGADKTLRDNAGEIPYDIAIAQDKYRAAELLALLPPSANRSLA